MDGWNEVGRKEGMVEGRVGREGDDCRGGKAGGEAKELM